MLLVRLILVLLLVFSPVFAALGDPALESVNNTWTWGDNTQATLTHTYDNTGTDVVLTVTSGVFNISTGNIQQGGTQVVLQSRTISAGVGLDSTTLGDLSANRTVSFDFTDAGADPALGAGGARFSNEGASAAGLVFEGDTNDTIETRFRITDPATSDRIVTFPNADSNTVQPLTCSGSDKVSAISALGVITCTTDTGSNPIDLATPEALTIATDTVTFACAADNFCGATIDTESAAAQDNLATCNCTSGSYHLVWAANDTRTVTIQCTSAADFNLDSVGDRAVMHCSATNTMRMVSRENGG